jgi:hypothetical protein
VVFAVLKGKKSFRGIVGFEEVQIVPGRQLLVQRPVGLKIDGSVYKQLQIGPNFAQVCFALQFKYAF